MTTQNPESRDFRALWKDQKSDYPVLSAEEVRRRVGSYHAKVRREGSLALALSAAVFLVSAGIALTGHPGRLIVMGVGMAAVWDLWWEIAVFFRTRDTVWPWLPKTAMTAEAPTACEEFYRVNLEMHRKHWFFRYMDLFAVSAYVVFLGVFRVRDQVSINFYVFTGVLIFLMVHVRRGQARRDSLEIDALDAVRK